ncbi:MAG: hypothetical protein EBS38_06675 [Actinobacteria bacterium]|nr:hypothetical protein [Actinomycetota bacterium]
MEWINFALIAAALYLLGLAGYRLVLALRALTNEVSFTTEKLNGFGADDFVLEPAKPSSTGDLAKLLSERRSMQRLKAREREERQRRLRARISSIDIDRR